ncbi:MAG: GNAT family N-acetyltransferase, partial [Gemmatimonadaceae bacterium]
IRSANISDIPKLLPLMRGLAEYEGYIDRFAVTEETLAEVGFHCAPPGFECLVAETDNGGLAGMLVFHLIPFTVNARPTLYMKELYVSAEERGNGIGEQLMRAAAAEAVRRDCGLMKWQVASWNTSAATFYTRLGATADPVWVDYALNVEALAALAGPISPE